MSPTARAVAENYHPADRDNYGCGRQWPGPAAELDDDAGDAPFAVTVGTVCFHRQGRAG